MAFLPHYIQVVLLLLTFKLTYDFESDESIVSRISKVLFYVFFLKNDNTALLQSRDADFES